MNTQKILIALCTFFLLSNALAQKKPNIIVVLADDLGIGDISYYKRMHSDNIIVETPNIDKLAKKSLVFTQAHAPAALCATSRYAIMSGNHCYRSHAPWGVWGGYGASSLNKKQTNLGKLMKQANYQTAFFGKWHMGTRFYEKGTNTFFRSKHKEISKNVDITKIVDDGPTQNGFDYSVTLPSGIQNEPYAIYENDKWLKLRKKSTIKIIDKKYMEAIGGTLKKKVGLGDSNWNPSEIGPILINKAVNYISEKANKENPFFMYYCSQAVHVPHMAAPKLDGVKIAGTTPSKHLDMVKELDVQMGMMVKELKKQGVFENTVFIFTSDNGGLNVDPDTRASKHNSSGNLRGHKNSSYEGGHRVPFIISWPESIKKSIESDNPVLGLDILATVAAISKQKIPKGEAVDSRNLLPIINGDKNALIHPFLMIQSGTDRRVIIIEDGWKLIIQIDKKDKTNNTRTPIALFNLKNNPKEKEASNLIKSKKHKKKVKYLFQKYNKTRDNKKTTGNSV